MTIQDRAASFRRLHAPGRLLVLPNAWDAGSARLIESLGAEAIATTSSGLCWAHGYADGKSIPLDVLARAIAEMVRVVSVPVSTDVEGGYSAEPARAAANVRSVIDAGAVGINLEDGGAAPELLAAKIVAVKAAARAAGVDLFVNARTDVYLKRLVPPERAVEETLARAQRYAEAGADGLFVPALAEAGAIRRVAEATALPLNLMVVPQLPPIAELRACGVRRVSAGSAACAAALGAARRAARQLLDEGRYEGFYEGPVGYAEMQALFPPPAA